MLGKGGYDVEGYLSTHPVGLTAAVGCGGQWNWDCTEANGVISLTGPPGAFVTNYGVLRQPHAYNNTAVVTCTSCHNQHLMNVSMSSAVLGTRGHGLPQGIYRTMFFIRGPDRGSGTAGSNQTAQFCRQCHGGEANESNGSYTIPTTF